MNVGLDASGMISYDGTNPTWEVPAGSGKHTIYSMTPWIGGYDNGGVLHMSAETYRQSRQNYHYGPIGMNDWDKDYFNRVWKVTEQEIQDHIANYSLPGYTAPDGIEYWPAIGNTPNGLGYAEFNDTDNDGLYDPAMGDYPCIKGNGVLFALFNDSKLGAAGEKMRLEIRLMIYAVSSAKEYVDNTIFFDLTFKNLSSHNYTNVLYGMYTDFDIGNSDDDYVGCDIDRNMIYAYNSDSIDEGSNGYGSPPPAQGLRVAYAPLAPLNDALDNNNDGEIDEIGERWGLGGSMYYNNNFTNQGNPSSYLDYYNYLNNQWLDGTQLQHNLGNGYGGVGMNTRFAYPDSTHSDYANPWSEVQAGNTAGDRRMLGIIGPFEFEQWKNLHFSWAATYSKASTGNHLSSLNKLMLDSDSVDQFFQVSSFLCDGSIGVDEVINNTSLILYPNPANDAFVISSKTPWEYVQIIDQCGREVGNYSNNENIIRVDHINAGIYYVIIRFGQSQTIRRLVIQ